MKPDLQRIEATLNQLDDLKASGLVPAPMRSSTRPYRLPPLVGRRSTAPQETTANPGSSGRELTLPAFQSSRSDQQRRTPAPVTYLLREIEAIANHWQDELMQVGQDIHHLYDEGPIVDGWLECHPHESSGTSTKLRHVDVTQLMDYVEEICSLPDPSVSCQTPQEGYRLCGLDEEGQFWSKPCPPEQVSSVSVAIARYHRLKQLLERQRFLENRLNQLTETLGALHHHLQN